eukprot:g32404.t1
MIHAIIGCQPLLVLRPTGPITLLFEKLLDFATAQNEEQQITHVRENRLAPLLCYFLIGLPLLMPTLLQSVPKAAVFGTLIFVGIDGIQSTQLYERCLLMLTDPRFVPKRMVNYYFGLYFPLFFISLAPFRRYLIPCIFSERDLKHLDHSLDDRDTSAKAPGFTRQSSIFKDMSP